MTGLSAPLFSFGDNRELDATDSYTHAELPGRSFSLSGPSPKLDKLHLPVRGDLAHIKLAGRCFVPHYAVPMPHRVKAAGAVLRVAGLADADAISEVTAGQSFDVLDIAGNWAWGQLVGPSGEDGVVGYIALDQLESVEG